MTNNDKKELQKSTEILLKMATLSSCSVNGRKSQKMKKSIRKLRKLLGEINDL